MDQFVTQVVGAIENLVEHMAKEDPEEGQKSELVAVTVPHSVPMPRAILANTEPYMHGDWRKEPYLPRSVLHLRSDNLLNIRATASVFAESYANSGSQATDRTCAAGSGHMCISRSTMSRSQTPKCCYRSCGPPIGVAATAIIVMIERISFRTGEQLLDMLQACWTGQETM